MCRQVAQSSHENFDHVQKFYATKILAKWSQSHRELVADPSQFSRNHFGTRHICEINKTGLRANYDINKTLRDNIASKLNKALFWQTS